MNIGQKIKELRKKRGLTQKELGKRLNVSYQMIAQYESGRRKPKIEQLRKIAQALSVDLSEFTSDNFRELPEFKLEVYGTAITNLIEQIKEGPCPLSKDMSNILLEELNQCIKKAYAIEDIELLKDFYLESEIKFSHKYLNALMKEYSEYSLTDVVNLLNYYLMLSEDAQNKVIEYEMDLYEVPLYRQKN